MVTVNRSILIDSTGTCDRQLANGAELAVESVSLLACSLCG